MNLDPRPETGSGFPLLESAGRGSPVTALAYLGAAGGQLLFLKELSSWLEPGAFGAVLGSTALMLGLSLLAAALRAASAASSAAALQRNEGTDLARFDRRLLLAGGLAVVLAVAFYGSPLAGWLRLPSRLFAGWQPLLAGASVLLGLAGGSLLGSGRERRYALLLLIDPWLRCGAFALFNGLGLGRDGSGPLAAIFIGLSVSIVFARLALPGRARDAKLPSRRSGHAVQLARPTALLALLSCGLLLFLDVALVRHFLEPGEAARFAAVAVASRFLILLPIPLALLLVPLVRLRIQRREPTLPAFLRTLGSMSIVLLLGLLAVNEFGGRLLAFFLDGDRYGDLRSEYIRYALAAAVHALSALLVFYGIALDRVSLALLPGTMLVIEVGLLLERGRDLLDCITVIQTMALAQLGALIVVVLLPLVWSRRSTG